MARLATTSPGEREDDEATRLVRPSPKNKPPRRDRRRERMKPDKDDDPDLKSKDTSLNYKVIGGSVQRVVARYFLRKAAETPPEPPQRPLPPRPRKKEDKIPVRNRETGEKVYVTRQTLKSEPSKYEKWQIKEKDEADDAKAKAPAQPAQTPPSKVPSTQPSTPPAAPSSQPAPSSSASPAPSSQAPAGQTPPASPAVQPQPGTQPGAPGQAPNSPAAKPGKPKKPPKQTPAEKHEIPPPKRRRVSPDERADMVAFLADHLPPKLASQLLASGMHPDDAKTFVKTFEAAKSSPVGNPTEFAAKMSKVFETNPAWVEPPKTWRAEDGTTVEFGILPPEIKAAAYRQHQMEVVAMSLGAQHQLQQKLSFDGKVSEDVAGMVAGAMLAKTSKAKAAKQARAIFESTAGARDSQKITERQAAKMLVSVEGNERATKLLRSYLEANDYKRAKRLYLGSTGGMTEQDSPGKIAESLRAARDYFTTRARAYGDAEEHEGAKRFETRTLGKLRKVAPKKYAKVRKAIDVEDAKVYDRKRKPWDAYDKALSDWQSLAPGAQKRKGRPEPPPGKRPVEPMGYANGKSPDDLKEAGKQLWEDLLDRTGTKKAAAQVATKFLLSSYLAGLPMDRQRQRRALYHGIEPGVNYPRERYPRGEQVPARALSAIDHEAILAAAKGWRSRVSSPEQALEMALQSGPYRVDVQTWQGLVERLSGSMRGASGSSFASARDTNRKTDNGVRHMLRLSSEDKSAANEILGRLDKLAGSITSNRRKWGMSFEAAKKLVNHLDRIADDTEALIFGEQSLRARQAEVAVLNDDFRQEAVGEGLITPGQLAKAAKVIQRDSDEPYMDTFANPMSPIETDSDEPYMAAYGDDQSSAVIQGEDETGRDLAP